MQSELAALESPSDERLWEVARSQVNRERQTRCTELLDKERTGRLSDGESNELDLPLYHSQTDGSVHFSQTPPPG